MKEFNPNKASLATFKRGKLMNFKPIIRKPPQYSPYTLNDLFNKLNLSRKLIYDIYASEKIVNLIEKQVDKIESKLIKQMVKTPEGTRLYWQRAFNRLPAIPDYLFLKIN